MRTHSHLFSATLVAAATACTDGTTPTSIVMQGDTPDFAAVAVDRPFSGRIAGALTAIPPFAPGSTDECNANFSGDPAAPGASISLFDDADGNFLHLGRVVLQAASCIDPASPFSAGTGTITAANGDQLFIAFENTSLPDPADPLRIIASGPQWVTGGTGRFENASGAQVCTFTIVLLSPSSARIAGECDGRITY